MILVSYLAFWNLGLFALAICVLAGCRTNMERNYPIINWPQHTLALIWGEECATATAPFIPDVYKLGTSGVCRVTDGKTSCKSKFPPSLNLARYVLEDLDKANTTDLEVPAILDQCREAIDKPIDHKTASRLGAAMVALIVTSMFINLISLGIAAATGNPFDIPTTFVLAVDALFIFTSLIMCIAMMNYEGGGYLKGVHGGEYSDREMIGLAIWFLLAMLLGRILSNPWLLLGALAIILPIVLVFLLFLVRTRGFFLIVRVAMAE